MAITYRPEVDGLRAIAVGAVLVYHAQFSISGHNPLPGGFLGVDIFFVISGYLISSIILRELAANSFSLLDFYHRRARRILPALFAIILASVVCGWFLLTPNAMETFSGSALSALFFGANFWFWAEDSYWAAPGSLKPLLHTWTLAVEEQFYIFFPLLLMFLWRRAKGRIFTIFVVLFIASLVLSQVGAHRFPDANFYLLPTRAWELLAGGMLAKLEMIRDRTPPRGWRKVLPSAGLALVIASFFLFSKETPHPSFLTLAPIAGVCLIVWFAKPGDPATAILSSKPFVAVGLISYSLYLWHYPAFAFARIKFGELSNSAALLLLIAVGAVSVLSYFLIEQPARKRSVLKTRVFAPIVASAFGLLLAANGALFLTDGYAARYGELAGIFDDAGEEIMAGDFEGCDAKSGDCIAGDAETPGSLILVGDSHAGVLNKATADLAKKYGLSYSRRYSGSCAHVDVEHIVFGECDAFRAETDKVMETAPPSIIVYALHWRKYQDRITGEGSYRGSVTPHPGETLPEAYRRTFEKWLDEGHRLAIILPGVESEEDMRELVKNLIDKVPEDEREAFMDQLKIEVDYSLQVERAAKEREFLQETATLDGVIIVDPLSLFCDQQKLKCELNEGRSLIVKDTTHYSPFAAEEIIASLEGDLRRKGWLKEPVAAAPQPAETH